MARTNNGKVDIQKIRVRGSDTFYSVARYGPEPDVSDILKELIDITPAQREKIRKRLSKA